MKKTLSGNNVIITAIICATVIIVAIICFLYFYPTKSGSGKKHREATTDIVSKTTGASHTAGHMYPGDINNPDSRFHSFDWLSERKLEISDISGLSAGDLRLLRNAIFAKHGYRFSSADLTGYFSRYSWYTPSRSDVSSQLSSIERANIDLISRYEGKGTKTTASSSSAKVSNVSFANDYSDIVCYTRLDDSDIAGLTKAEIRILRNTIYARHGRSFKSSDLNNYFRGFSWYRPYRSEVPPTELSAIEKHNIDLLSRYE